MERKIKTLDVRKIIIHILSQINYKKGCLGKVISDLKGWENKELVEKALKEILNVYKRFDKFSAKSYDKVKEYIEHQFKTSRKKPAFLTILRTISYL